MMGKTQGGGGGEGREKKKNTFAENIPKFS